MKAERILRQMCLLVAFLMLDAEGILRLTEGKTFPKTDQAKAGTAPSVFISPKYRTVREGNGLSLFCTATGKPRPRIRWKKNGNTITLDNRIRIRVNETGSKLRIKNSTIKDSGIYHCVAKLKNHHVYSASERVIVDVVVGTCDPYTGSVCSSYISKDTRVLIPPLTTQQQSEDNVILAASALTDYINPTCKKSLLKALCYNLFPPCHSSRQAKPMQMCKDECEVFQASTCSKEFRLLRERLGSSLAEEIIPNCASLTRYCSRNKTVPGRDSCQKGTADVSQAVIKPLRKNYPICRENRKVKIYNREVSQLVRNIKSELHNGGMSLTSHSSELSTYCFSAAVPLSKLVREWNMYYSTLLLPNFQRPHDLTVPGLKISTLNSSVNSIWIPLGTSAKYKVHEEISLRNVTFYFRWQSGHGSFIAEGEYKLCETTFRLTVETLYDGTIKISGFSETPLDVSDIETPFVSARPPNMLVDAIKDTNLFVLRMMKPTMEAYISKDLMVKFSGKSYFGPRALPVTLEFFGGKLRRQDVLLVGITSTRLTLNEAREVLFSGFTVPIVDITKHSPNGSSVGIILSAHALDLSKTPYRRFQQQPLTLAFEGTVPLGLSLVTRASVPVETHNSSQVCQLFQTIFGRGSDYTLKVSTNRRHITFDWHFHRLSNSAITSLDRMQMKMEINDTSQPRLDFPVDGTFYKSGQQSKGVPFSGQLTYEGSLSHLQGDFRTQFVWKNAFGIEYLAMNNLRLGLSLPTDQSQKSSIRGEADLQLGSDCNTIAIPSGENDSIKRNCVTGHLYLGFSDESADHFFYGTLAPVSLQKLLEVCNIKHKLPGALATIGFPEGLQISVARGAYDLRSLGGPNLKPGFILAGNMSVLGIETTGAISLLPREFLIDAKIMSDEAPATLDDVTPLYMSSSDPEEKPKVFLKARMDPVPFVKVDGYARLFGIFKEVRMLVTSDSLQMYLTTEVNKSFKINVHVATNYSSDRNETQFNATVVFDNGLSKLTRLASKQVVSMLEAEMSKLKSAKGEVQRLRRECVKTIKRECSSCLSRRECASFLRSVDTSMALKPSTNTSEKKRDIKRTGSTIDICHQLVLDHCLTTETASHNACRFISSKLNKTCAAHEAAAKSQRELERGLRWVKQAEQFMYSDLFQIHSISFKTNVTSANLEQIYLDTVLEVTIFGQKHRLDGLRMDFNEFVKLSSEIAKYAMDWYQKTQPQTKPKSRHPDNRPRQ